MEKKRRKNRKENQVMQRVLKVQVVKTPEWERSGTSDFSSRGKREAREALREGQPERPRAPVL